MKIAHVAVWVKNIEGVRKFYETYFYGCRQHDICKKRYW